jgi:hypothetical protein
MVINGDTSHDGGDEAPAAPPSIQDMTRAAEPPPTGPVGPGVPDAPRPRRRRIGLIIGIAVALVLLGAGIWYFALARGTSPARLVLPHALLGLSQGTGPGARSLDSRLRHGAQAANLGKDVHVVAAVYGNPAGRWFALAGGGLCAGCAPRSARALVQGKVAKGFTDARSFPPGPRGGALVCGSQNSPAGPVINCTWADPRTLGDVFYFGGLASGLADAAAMTRHILAVVEH